VVALALLATGDLAPKVSGSLATLVIAGWLAFALAVPGRVTRPLQTLASVRSEEHTSELQSLTNLVCRLLLETKKITRPISPTPAAYLSLSPLFFNATAPTEIYPLSLHDALPIFVVALALLATGDLAPKVSGSLATLVIAGWLAFALAVPGRVTRPLQTLASV